MNFEQIKKDLTKTYDDLAAYWGDRTLQDWGYDDIEKFSKMLGKGAKVLDLGCASGFQSKLLTEAGLEVIGLDLSGRMIQEAKKRVPQAKFIKGDMTQMKFKDGYFDGVYSRASVLHIPKKLIPVVFKKVFKMVKKGGIFYLAVKEGNFEGYVEGDKHGLKVDRFFSYFSEAEMKDILNGLGFEILSTDYYMNSGESTKWLKIFCIKI